MQTAISFLKFGVKVFLAGLAINGLLSLMGKPGALARNFWNDPIGGVKNGFNY